MRSRAMVFALPACFAGSASAQSIYIDFGAVTGTPSSAFGGASGAPGVWNAHNGAEGVVGSLLDIGGVTTGASLTLSAAGATGVTDGLEGLSGDTAAMMGDYVFGTFNDLTLEFSGLAPGAYRVVTYAVVGQSATTFDTEVWLQGDTATTQVISGEWSGAFAIGATHSEHAVDLSNGLLRIDVVRPADAVLNGVQLILIPTPGTAAALLSAGFLGLARRRR